MSASKIGQLRRIGIIEAWSFLILLGIAMPLKYFAGRPEAVKVVGWAHGVLFILYCWAAFRAAREHAWTFKRTVMVLAASLIPFGPFLIDPDLRREEQAHLAADEA